MRTCPTCEVALVERHMARQDIDRCPSCAGAFFDAGELEAIVGLVGLLHGAVLDEPEIDSVSVQEHDRIVHCPADRAEMTPEDVGGLVMDVCPTCKGIWLDSGEVTGLKLAERNIAENLNLYIRLGN